MFLAHFFIFLRLRVPQETFELFSQTSTLLHFSKSTKLSTKLSVKHSKMTNDGKVDGHTMEKMIESNLELYGVTRNTEAEKNRYAILKAHTLELLKLPDLVENNSMVCFS